MAGKVSPPRESKLVKFRQIICPPNNASCTPLLKFAIQKLDWLNAHWYNSFYEFRITTNSCLQLATWNTLRCKVFPLTAILTALIPMLSLVLEEYVYRTGNVTLVRMACYLVGSALATALLSMFLVLFIYPEAAPAINSLYSLGVSQRTRCNENAINNPNHRFPVDWNGILAIIFVFGLAYPLPIFCFFACYRKMDPYFHLFKQLLPSSLLNSSGILALRVVLTFVAGFEYVRLAFVLCLLSLTIVLNAIKQLNSLKHSHMFLQNIKMYTQIQVIFKILHCPLKADSLLAMGGSQFYVSPEAVLIIIGWDKLPIPLTVMFLMIFSLAVLVVFMYAKSAAKLGETSRELIFCSIQNLRKSPRGKEWSLKLMSKVWSGKDRIRMYYGDGRSLEFQQDSPVEYLFVLLNNITNLLMLFAV
ncbi:unnamed protein product [Orchesella dallaii]|uniref:Uncharacterized protein n=1 Tax=Orchesella dallaii TaxID=48710 RepID=A0ABP1RHA8_9HEXA